MSLLLDKILQRAVALRTLRDKATNRHEAEAAARALAALLDKHQIGEAALPAGVDAQQPAVDYEPLYSYRRIVAWKMMLARVLWASLSSAARPRAASPATRA